jgi:hypothetical protein
MSVMMKRDLTPKLGFGEKVVPFIWSVGGDI